MCDCKKSKMKVCPFLPFSYGLAWEIDGKWRDLGENLGKPPCKVVPVLPSRIDLNIKVIGSDVHSSVYDKRDDF